MAKERMRIKAIIIWIKSREKKLFNQHLNRLDVDLLIRHKKANGESNTSTLVIIYLTENDKIREKEEMDNKQDIIPLKVKMLNFPFVEKFASLSIKFAKEMFCLKIVWPRAQIKSVIWEVKERIPVQIWKELKTTIPITTDLTRNLEGASTSLPE